jgi:serine/threonine-protein kinase
MKTTSRQMAPKTRVIALGDLTREFPPGTRVDRYEIVATLGSGGCGVVYAARHIHLDQTVALKLLHKNLVGSPERVQRFFREAKAAAAVGNPHIVRVSDCSTTDDGIPFLAMEFLKGVVLADLVDDEQALPLERALEIVYQVLDGLSAAHAAGVVHRDLKPENIFLVPDPETGDDFVKILDFGVSKIVTGGLDQTITNTGALLGTPRYMAPEQFKGAHSVDHRADLFAVSVVLFQMLTGVLPFEGDSPLALAHRAATQPPRPLHELAPHVPEAVCEVVLRGLAKKPEERWQSAQDFAEALRDASRQGLAEAPTGVEEPDVRTTDVSDTFKERPAGMGPASGEAAPTESVPMDEAALEVDLDDSTLRTGEGPPPGASAGPAGGDPERAPTPVPEGLLDLETEVSLPSQELSVLAEDDLGGELVELSPPARPAAQRRASPLVAGDEVERTVPWGSDAEAPAPEPVGEALVPARGVLTAPAFPAPLAPLPAPPPQEPLPAPVQAAPPPAPATPAPAPISGPAPAASAPSTRSWKLVALFAGFASLVGGIVLGAVLLATGVIDVGGASAPQGSDGSGVRLADVEVEGDLPEAAIAAVFDRAHPYMEMCRRPEAARVALEARIGAVGTGAERLSVVRPVGAGAEPSDAARCCVDAFVAGVPPDWAPTGSGVATFEIVLPAR